MAEGISLINFGDLSKPATVLIEKVSNAVGFLYEPIHVKRMARASAEAEKIKLLSGIEMNELQQRAMVRFVHQESRKQENYEKITAQAIAALPHDAKVGELDEDWIAHFFKQCDAVSNAEMQSLWARLLSGEATKPGSFSKRTVDFVATMDKADAALFSAFCQFAWRFDELVPLVFDLQASVCKREGLSFSALKHLDAIGLISFDPVGGYSVTSNPKERTVSYFDHQTVIEFPLDEENELPIGKAILTATGAELAEICGARPNEEIYEHAVREWFKNELVLSSVFPKKKHK